MKVDGSDQRYKPFGEKRFLNSTQPSKFGYTGQRDFGDFGLMDYGARMYSPLLGRFLSADTIVPSFARPQSLNRYAYVENRPMVMVDPTGHCGSTPTGQSPCFDAPTATTPTAVNTVAMNTSIIVNNNALSCDVHETTKVIMPSPAPAEIRPLPTTIERQMLMNGKGASLFVMAAPILAPLSPAAAEAFAVGAGAEGVNEFFSDGKVNADSVIQSGLINIVGGKVADSAVFKAFGSAGKLIGNIYGNVTQGVLSASAECAQGNCSNSETTIASGTQAGPIAPIASKVFQSLGVPRFLSDFGGEVIKVATQRLVFKATQSQVDRKYYRSERGR